jgi:hypothetical protein
MIIYALLFDSTAFVPKHSRLSVSEEGPCNTHSATEFTTDQNRQHPRTMNANDD